MTPKFDANYFYLSSNLVRAFEYAARAHKDQKRKDGKTPYISHPAGVAFILVQAGCSEETIIAGLLHDVIEDTSESYEDIAKEFGTKIADLVKHVSIPAGLKHDEGKEAYIKHLKEAPKEAAYISAADLLYNRTDNILDFEKGHNSWGKFPELPRKLLDLDRKRIEVIKSKIGEHKLIDDLEKQHESLRKQFNV